MIKPPLRGALVGLGNVAIHGHLPGWLERAEVRIVAATDAQPTQQHAMADKLPHAQWFETIESLLAGMPLDFIDICTPPGTHSTLIEAALRHGLHVLCEKPLVSCLEDFQPLADLARRRQRVLYTVHNWHEAPLIRKISELLGQGLIGDIRSCVWQVLRTQPAVANDAHGDNWRVNPDLAGGGVLLDHGWHALYVLTAWMGRHPTCLRAQLEIRRHTQWPVEDTASIEIEFPSGKADMFLTWAAETRMNEIRLEGTEGTIRVEDDWVLLNRAGDRTRKWSCPPSLSKGSHHPDWFGGVASRFLTALSGDTAEQERNLSEAALCATLIAKAQESSRTGGIWLPVPAFTHSGNRSVS